VASAPPSASRCWHEAEHAHLGHSAARLALEILRVVFWFNPVLWLYQRSLAHLHELQAAAAVAHRFDARAYARLLLHLHGGAGLPLTNLFSRQPLKDRLAALFQTKPTSAMKKLLYLAALPVALVATVFLAQSVSPPTVAPASPRSPPATRPFLKGGTGFTIFLAKPRAVSMYLNSADFNPNYVRQSTGTFQKIGYRAEMTGVGYDANEKLIAANFKLVRNSDGKTATATFNVSDLLRTKRHVHLYANQTTGNFFVRSESDATFERMFPDVKIEKRKQKRSTVIAPNR